ncbi:MAG TPA: acetamidase/formamidase family protein [Ktedonobacteraceae bacterium]|nr:acetamidase/formamidase family protein [Ktedonobacteraceae bacterium]
MTSYSIEPDRATLHGSFSRDYAPVLRIDSGDTVRFRTLDSGWNLEPPHEGRATQRFEPRDKERDGGHALCGPVYVRGAQPGMALEVRINDIRPGAWGWVAAGGRDSSVNRALGLIDERIYLDWSLDTDTMTGRDQFGDTVALRPFMGVMGLPPDEPGIHSTVPPRYCGGNIDCKELVAGSTLYLPIAVPGALFSTGDGHAVQGDGEVSGVAIECGIDMVDLTFHVREDLHLKTPRARIDGAWITLGFHEDLHEASLLALDTMLDIMMEQHGISKVRALALASVVVDLRVTQIANGVHGVHAMLPDERLAISL